MIANFSKQVSAQNVELKIPVPPNTANVIPKVAFGTATYILLIKLLIGTFVS